MARCQDCKRYPNNCITWDKSVRRFPVSAHYMSKSTVHNCIDFVLKSPIKLTVLSLREERNKKLIYR